MEAIIITEGYIRKNYNKQDTFSTKEIAASLGISTHAAYIDCVRLERIGILCKNGYRIKGGWEDPEFSNLRPSSLYWQVLTNRWGA